MSADSRRELAAPLDRADGMSSGFADDAGTRVQQPATLEFAWITDADDFVALGEEWDALCATSVDTVFLTHAWLSNWLGILGQEWQPRVLTARGPAGLVAALPLASCTVHGTRRVAFMGTGALTPNHLDVIALPGYEEEARRGFILLLTETAGTWDVLEFDKLPADSATPDALRSAFGDLGFRTSLATTAICPYTHLPDTFDEYFASRSKLTRRHTRERQRHLARDHPEARFGMVTNEAELSRALEALVRLHQKRWESKGYAGSFADPRVVRFHEATTRDALHAGKLRFYTLTEANSVVVAQLCYRTGGCTQVYSWAFDEDWAAYRLGMLFNSYATEQAILEGATRVDHLEGDYPHKWAWAMEKRENVRLRIFGRTARGRLLRSGEQAAAWTLAVARRVLPEALRESVRKRLSVLRDGRARRNTDG